MEHRRREADEQQVARARWGNKMIEFVGADMQRLVTFAAIVLVGWAVIYDNRDRARIAAEQTEANSRTFLAAHGTTQALIKETLIVMRSGQADASRHAVNTIYVLSLSPEERAKLRLEVPADFRPYYRQYEQR